MGVIGVQVRALNWPGSAFDISKEGNWLATGDSEGNVRVRDATGCLRPHTQHILSFINMGSSVMLRCVDSRSYLRDSVAIQGIALLFAMHSTSGLPEAAAMVYTVQCHGIHSAVPWYIQCSAMVYTVQCHGIYSAVPWFIQCSGIYSAVPWYIQCSAMVYTVQCHGMYSAVGRTVPRHPRLPQAAPACVQPAWLAWPATLRLGSVSAFAVDCPEDKTPRTAGGASQWLAWPATLRLSQRVCKDKTAWRAGGSQL
jgi:hypothetical protein